MQVVMVTQISVSEFMFLNYLVKNIHCSPTNLFFILLFLWSNSRLYSYINQIWSRVSNLRLKVVTPETATRGVL